MTVFVVTNPEAGWDCVLGVYLHLYDAVDSNGGEYTSDMEGNYTTQFEASGSIVLIHKRELQ
jgi:hypothetical protein